MWTGAGKVSVCKMHLLFIIDSFGSGGAQRQMVNLALGLHHRGHQIEFFVYHPQYRHLAEPVEQANIPVHRYRKSHRFSLRVIWVLHRQLVRGNYDAVLAFLNTPCFYAEVARIGLHLRRPALVVSERFMYLPGRLPLKKWLRQQLHRLADHITVNSHHQRERMEREFPWMREKITTIYNGVDLQEFSPPSPAIPTRLGPLNLLAIGSIVAKKNALGLMQALAIYRERYGNPPWVHWAGRRLHSKQSEKDFSEAAKLLDRLELNGSWNWLGERSDVPALLRECDALVHPSFYEGLPNAICEALASGRPVLASDVCDHSRLVQNGVTGFLFDPHRPEDMARAIYNLAAMSPTERAAMGLQARMFAEQHLSKSRLVDDYEHLFCSLLE